MKVIVVNPNIAGISQFHNKNTRRENNPANNIPNPMPRTINLFLFV
jgi:hypothetical protein